MLSWSLLHRRRSGATPLPQPWWPVNPQFPHLLFFDSGIGFRQDSRCRQSCLSDCLGDRKPCRHCLAYGPLVTRHDSNDKKKGGEYAFASLVSRSDEELTLNKNSHPSLCYFWQRSETGGFLTLQEGLVVSYHVLLSKKRSIGVNYVYIETKQ